jgi:hypothetical protein
MLPFERLVVAYLAFFAVAALFTHGAPAGRTRTALAATSLAVAVYLVSRLLPIAPRLWLPFLYIPIGYWIPVPLVPTRRGGAFEAWLVRTDAALRGAVDTMPRWLAYSVEIGYLFCFPLIPISFAIVWTAGSQAQVVRFWTAVLAAAYVCYVTLPWLVSRPPRLIAADTAPAAATAVRRANVFVLGRVSHHLNTFPSGHVAVSVAAAIAAGRVMPIAGVVLGVIAAGVALGSVTGRYHFIVDALLGIALGIIVSAG